MDNAIIQVKFNKKTWPMNGFSFVLLAALICLFSAKSFGQLKLNSKAPKIEISTWINKKGPGMALENKFVVLDFWATWCAPCLGALPHMNQLQQKFSHRNDLVFLSITDESPNKVNQILPRFHFESFVVTDTTGNTQDRYGVNSLPAIFLIDNKGIIRWTGDPKELTEEMFHKFLKGEGLTDPDKKEPVVINNRNSLDSLWSAYVGVFNNKEIDNYLSIAAPGIVVSGRSVSRTWLKSYARCKVGVKVSALFASLLQCNERHIELPPGLKDSTISYCYKNNNVSSKKEGDSLLLHKIAQQMGLHLTVRNKPVDALVLEVTEPSKLDKVKVTGEKKEMAQRVSISDDFTVISIVNITLEVLETELNKVQGKKVEIKNLRDFPGGYSLTLSNRSGSELQKSLLAYGISVKEAKRGIQVFQFNRN